MKRLFPIFVLSCIVAVVIGSRVSRRTTTDAAPASADVKAGESKPAKSLRQATAQASSR